VSRTVSRVVYRTHLIQCKMVYRATAWSEQSWNVPVRQFGVRVPRFRRRPRQRRPGLGPDDRDPLPHQIPRAQREGAPVCAIGLPLNHQRARSRGEARSCRRRRRPRFLQRFRSMSSSGCAAALLKSDHDPKPRPSGAAQRRARHCERRSARRARTASHAALCRFRETGGTEICGRS
jgi:hypothetical protein